MDTGRTIMMSRVGLDVSFDLFLELRHKTQRVHGPISTSHPIPILPVCGYDSPLVFLTVSFWTPCIKMPCKYPTWISAYSAVFAFSSAAIYQHGPKTQPKADKESASSSRRWQSTLTALSNQFYRLERIFPFCFIYILSSTLALFISSREPLRESLASNVFCMAGPPPPATGGSFGDSTTSLLRRRGR
jgi:hypothetical protein